MAREIDEKIVEQAKQLYMQGKMYKDIAAELSLSLNTLKWLKKREGWSRDRKLNIRNQKTAATEANINHGLASQYFMSTLEDDEKKVFTSLENMDPASMLWINIEIQFMAILRAQRIMKVKDQEDCVNFTTYDGEGGTGTEWHTAWDRQSNFLQAQSKAMLALTKLIRTYVHMTKEIEQITEERRERIALIRTQMLKIKEENNNKTRDIQVISNIPEKATREEFDEITEADFTVEIEKDGEEE